MAITPKLSPKQYKLLVKAATIAINVNGMTGPQIGNSYPKLWEVLRQEEWGNFWWCVLVDIARNQTDSRYFKAIVNA